MFNFRADSASNEQSQSAETIDDFERGHEVGLLNQELLIRFKSEKIPSDEKLAMIHQLLEQIPETKYKLAVYGSLTYEPQKYRIHSQDFSAWVDEAMSFFEAQSFDGLAAISNRFEIRGFLGNYARALASQAWIEPGVLCHFYERVLRSPALSSSMMADLISDLDYQTSTSAFKTTCTEHFLELLIDHPQFDASRAADLFAAVIYSRRRSVGAEWGGEDRYIYPAHFQEILIDKLIDQNLLNEKDRALAPLILESLAVSTEFDTALAGQGSLPEVESVARRLIDQKAPAFARRLFSWFQTDQVPLEIQERLIGDILSKSAQASLSALDRDQRGLLAELVDHPFFTPDLSVSLQEQMALFVVEHTQSAGGRVLNYRNALYYNYAYHSRAAKHLAVQKNFARLIATASADPASQDFLRSMIGKLGECKAGPSNDSGLCADLESPAVLLQQIVDNPVLSEQYRMKARNLLLLP